MYCMCMSIHHIIRNDGTMVIGGTDAPEQKSLMFGANVDPVLGRPIYIRKDVRFRLPMNRSLP